MPKRIRGLGGRSVGGSQKRSGQMGDLLKQAQKAQEEMEGLEEKFKEIKVEASAGGGVVKVRASCDYRVEFIEISEELGDEPLEIVQDLVIAAVNEALELVSEKRNEETAKVTGSLGIPDSML